MGSKGREVCTCRWLLLVPCFLMAVSFVVGDRASSQCVQLGQSIGFASGFNPTYTIGTRNFTTENIRELGNTKGFNKAEAKEHLNDTCEDNGEYVKGPLMDYCPKNVEIRTNLVRQNGIVLRGWLHVEIYLKEERGDTMEYIYVQVRDEHFSAIGEFVTDKAEQCKTDIKGLVRPTPYQVYPCSAIGFREAKASSAVFVAKRSQYVTKFEEDSPYLTNEDLTRGIHFIWKLSEFWCSRHRRFRFEANILTTNQKNVAKKRKHLVRKAAEYWLHPAWFGAADVKVGENDLDCKLPAINYATGEVSNEAAESWIQSKATRLTFGNDLTNPADANSEGLLNCVLYPYDESPENNETIGTPTTIPTFGGRCVSHTNTTPSYNSSRECNNDTSSPEFAGLNFTSYSEYTFNITQGRLKLWTQICVHPDKDNKTHLDEITHFPNRSGNRTIPKERVTLGVLREARGESRNTTFWQTRKFHGNLCVFVAMFLIPVSNFVARYYKETFMVNHHTIPAWLWSHGSTGYFALTLIRCSYTAMRDNINNWGQSTSHEGEMHRFWGYTFIIIYTLMSTIGGFRIMKNRLKVASVIAHAVTGFALYFMTIYLVISSQYIPGSPSANCNETSKLPEGYSETAIYASVWLGLDILFHIMMTVWQIMLDRREHVRRPFGMGFIFVPMLQPKQQRNFTGAGFRKIVLVVYATVSATMTFLVIGGMFVNDDNKSCELGNFTCNDTQNPFGCSPIAKKYFNIVTTERYNVTDLEN